MSPNPRSVMIPPAGEGRQLIDATAINVAIVDGNGDQVTSFGGSGGTSSSFGATFPASGTAAGATDGTNMRPLKVDGSGNLLIAGSLTTSPPAAGTSSISSVADSATNVTLLSSNAARLGVIYTNDSTAIAYLKEGATATTSSYSKKLLLGQDWEPLMNYTGRVDCIWASAPGGAMRITELSA